MPVWRWTLVISVVLSAGCGLRPLTAERAATVDREVRELARVVAHDVTAEGPLAWQKYLDKSPSFFLAANGQLVFPNGASVPAGMQSFARGIQHIELQWGEDLRVDPLAEDLAAMAASYREILVSTDGARTDQRGFFTGTAEYREGRWEFRNQHWSVPVTPAGAR
jgi:hypothetical protein